MNVHPSRFFLSLVMAGGILESVGCSEFVDRVPADTGADGGEDTAGDSPCLGVVCDDSDPCTADRCEPTTGQCVHTARPDGGTCDDGLFCTASDQCVAGACVGAVTDCPDDVASCRMGECDEAGQACVLSVAPDTTPCDDGNPCTEADMCAAGACESGPPTVCPDSGVACRVQTCSPELGCSESTAADEAVCNDADPCTENDRCASGSCGGVILDCSGLDEPCRKGICDAVSGQCVREDLDAIECDDSIACTVNDVCVDGACTGAALTCDAFDTACTEGACVPETGECVAKPVALGQPCDDTNPCTTASACEDGQCKAKLLLDCSALNSDCGVGVCAPASGACVVSAKPDGSSCDDGDLCTEADECALGSCEGAPKNCVGVSPICHSAVCSPTNGVCTSAPDPGLNGTECSDDLFCTVNGVCSGGVCQLSSRDCSDLAGICETAACDEVLDQCAVSPAENGAACSDGKGCTTQDLCDGGECKGTAALDCSSLDGPCAQGQCSEAVGCIVVTSPPGSSCTDGKVCTEDDVCVSGECVGTAKDCASLTTDCRVGTCSEDTLGCTTISVPDGSFCSDSVDCTLGDACSNGVCAAGAPVDCPCTHPARAISLDGGCLKAPGRPLLDSALGFTIELWVRTTSTASARLLDQRLSTVLGENDWSIVFEAPGGKGQLRFLYGNTSGADSQIGMTGVTLNDGQWHHVALVRDGVDVRWWIDGSGQPINNTANMQSLSNASELAIGCGKFGGETFAGVLDELVISDYPRYRAIFEPPGRHDLTLGVISLYRFDDVQMPVDTVTGTLAVVEGAASASQEVPEAAETCCGDGLIEAGEACDGVQSSCSALCESTSIVAQSALFDGGGSCLDVPGPVDLDATALTLEFWAQTTTPGTVLFDKRTSVGADTVGWAIQLDAAGKPSFVGGTAGPLPGTATAASSITDGQWHHVAVYHFAGNKIKWFIDGVPATSVTLDGLESLNSSALLRMGCGLTGAPYSGRLDGVRISVTTRYVTGFVPDKTPAPDAHTELLFTFDLPAIGGVVRDLSPGQHDGNANSGVSITPGAP